ncbi:MAG: GNAT family protein [Candidatus Cloacimonetes bacterium]|nr:GNAT family protein [Candidatus Cloacimonadota bacterium]
MFIEQARELIGVGCSLRPISASDTETIVNLRTGNRMYQQNHPEDRTSIEQHERWFKKYLSKGDSIHWLILEKSTGEAVGTTALCDYDQHSHKVRSGPFLISDDARIYAFECQMLRLEFAFEQMEINKVYAIIRTASTEAFNLAIKIGYRHDGLLRQDWWSGYEYLSYNLVSMLRDEYFENKDSIYKPYLKKVSKLFDKGRL